MHTRISVLLGWGATALTLSAAMPAVAASLQSASRALDAAHVHGVQFSGTGTWFQFGQAPAPDLPWPRFDVSRYSTDIDYDHAAARVQITRLQTVEAGRLRPAPVEQKVDQYVHGSTAWNLPTAGNSTTPVPQPAAVAERLAEIWSTPQGFLRAATAHHAESSPLKGGGVEVSFTVGGHTRFVGAINAANRVEWIRTWIDTPVLGDTPVETRFSDYRDFGGKSFPGHIERLQGGYPVLDLKVSEVHFNPSVSISVPAEALQPAPAPVVTADKLANGVYYLTGGTHHSVLIEQTDHLIVVEAPLNEARSLAVIAKAKELAPGKPIRYLVNTHAHFDHSGGLRTFVDAGASIVTPKANIEYYRKVWAAPRDLSPDRLAQSSKGQAFVEVGDKQVLSDGKRAIEIHTLKGSGHNDAFAVVYLPAEKILVEADAFTPGAPNTPPPAQANPYSVNLDDNIRRLGLDVERIAPLHGRLVTLADLRSAIGRAR